MIRHVLLSNDREIQVLIGACCWMTYIPSHRNSQPNAVKNDRRSSGNLMPPNGRKNLLGKS